MDLAISNILIYAPFVDQQKYYMVYNKTTIVLDINENHTSMKIISLIKLRNISEKGERESKHKRNKQQYLKISNNCFFYQIRINFALLNKTFSCEP